MRAGSLSALAVAGIALAAAGGYWVGHRDSARKAGSRASSAVPRSAVRKPLYWVSPMNPNYRSSRPGKSPMGMDLVPVYADESGGAHADVHISPAVIDELGVRTTAVRRGMLAHTIRAVGYVAYDEDTLRAIHTRADGWIEKLGVNAVGDRVRRGQLLYELFSPKLATSEREYLIALRSGDQGLIAASAERLRSLGFSGSQVHALSSAHTVHDRVARRADHTGVVVDLGVRQGAYVMPATVVMKLADLHTIWIQVEVDESHAPMVSAGESAYARVDAFPGRLWRGTVDYVYPDIDPTTRTEKVRLRFANSGERLKPNMFARVRIEVGALRDTLYIPQQALIQTGHSQRVVVALGRGNFAVCPVEAGHPSGNDVQILRGLRVGQKVVVSAQFMLDSEANVDAAALRLDAKKAACNAPAARRGSGGQR